MSGRRVVKRYARALVESARETSSLERVREDMGVVGRLMKSTPEIRSFCLAVHASRETETEFLSIAFIPYVGDYTARTLHLLVENGRLAAAPFLPEAVEEYVERLGDSVTVLLESAHEPDGETSKLVEAVVAGKTGRKIHLLTKVVPQLLGGFRITWQNRTIDMSVKGRLRKIRVLLKQDDV